MKLENVVQKFCTIVHLLVAEVGEQFLPNILVHL